MDLWEYDKLKVPHIPNHAFVGSLLGKDLIEQFQVYRKRERSTTTTGNKTKQENPYLLFNFTIGNRLTGHEGITHGGIITLLFDEAMGWAFREFREDKHVPALTANLNVNFRHPIKVGHPCQIRVYCRARHGRKMEMEGVLQSIDGSTVFAAATSVFITVSSRL